MGTTPPVLSAILPLVEAGAACHWLRPRSKAPLSEGGWSTAPVASASYLTRTYREGYNVGIRLGEPSCLSGLYLHLIDLDIRKPELADVAWARLLELLPGARTMPTVRSGSGGESRHIYFLTDRPFDSRKLAVSDGFEMVADPKTGREIKKRDWEIDLFGTGKQAAMPPSIHPDTGKPYVWERPLDLDGLDLGLGPVVDSAVVAGWGARRTAAGPDDVNAKPALGLTLAEAKAALDDLPFDEWCEDRDGWLQVGMALHHEFDGSEDALDLWNEFSSRSGKFDPEDQERVWRSFRKKSNSVRMATIIKAAATARLVAQFDDLDEGGEDDLGLGDDDDLSDLGLDLNPPAPAARAAAADDLSDLFGAEHVTPEAATPEALKEHPVTNPDNREWRQLLHLNEDGVVKATLHNLEIILRHDPRTRGIARFNEFTQEVVYRGEPGRVRQRKKAPKAARQLLGPIWKLRDPVNGDLWTDEKDNAIRAVLEAPTTQGGYGIRVSDRDLKAAVDLVARDASFHPVREYLNGLAWDGVPRMAGLFTRYLGAPDTPYTREVARLMLLGAVVRAFEPGHKFDFVVIYEGLQGKRKSTFISTLAKNWFAELDGDFHDTKQMVELMQGAWIMEIPELQGFSRADVRVIKAFISRTEDKTRLAYARRARVFPRQCIFNGSTNDRAYLRDDTGGRRFWPIECTVTEIDTDHFAANVDQVWAEAVTVYRQMRKEKPFGLLPLYLTDPEARAEAEAMQESRRVESAEDGLAGRIAAWLDTPIDPDFEDLTVAPAHRRRRNEVCLIEIYEELLGGDPKAYAGQASISQALGRAMKRVQGWTQVGTRKTAKYGPQRVYRRVDAWT